MSELRNLSVLLLSCFTLATVDSTKVRNVYWNTTTASLINGPLTVMVNQGNLPWEYDQVNLICPVVKKGDGHVGEQHVIYSVEKDEFENCKVTNPRPRIVAVCNRPDTFMYFTITFRSFTPTPGGLEFRPGQEYYFISTANTRDIHRRVGGWCKSHNMKMIVKVAENDMIDNTISDTTTRKPRPIPTPAAFWSKYWNAKVPTHKEHYKYERNYHQTQQDTYFSQYNERDSSQEENVDIRIIASAYSSSSIVIQSMVLVMSMTGMLFSL